MSLFRTFSSISGALLLFASGVVIAQDLASGEPQPLTIEITANLQFSKASVSNKGTGAVHIDPATGMKRVEGGAVDLGGYAMAGRAVISGEPGRTVRVDFPRQVRMSSGQGPNAELVDITTSLGSAPRLDIGGRLEFTFGGRLVMKGKAVGNLRGRIPITAEYE